MINFRKSSLVFITLLAAMIVVRQQFSVPWYVFVILILAYLGLLVYGSINVASNFYLPVICYSQTDERKIALSFDDGPVAAATPRVLDMLGRENIPAAFFCIGKNIAGNEAIVQRILSEGHIIGNHSYSHHFFFDLFPALKMKADVLRMEAVLATFSGHRPLLFRPPYGVTTPVMRNVLKETGYTAIGWSVRSMDTVIRDEQQLLQKIMKGLRPGALILLHDAGHCTLNILPAFIAAARKEGYQFVRPDHLLNVLPYA